jgi:hypothetical protein
LVESVATLIWAAPRLQSDIQELRMVKYFVLKYGFFYLLTLIVVNDLLLCFLQIADQLGQKYGKQFAEQAAGNTNKTVNEKVSLTL